MSVTETIKTKIEKAVDCDYLDVVNESYMHKVPPGSESHFKVVIVSRDFDGQMRVKRHRSINALLKDEFAQGLHALSIQAYTPDEWQTRAAATHASPPCRGGSARS